MKGVFLVPIDETSSCLRAIDYAVELAGDAGYSLELLNVQPKVHTSYARKKIGFQQLQEFKLEQAEKILEKGKHRVGNRVEVACKVKNGLPAYEICSEAKNKHIKGIIMSPKKRKKTIGSVSHKVLQLADCPVIIVP
ncbi:universal stress protein [Sediminibacillus massiliensis]|uniref:universal stress protein n=1 Tax=Sediminibacillus massiliensis TaxID=1926277 RepID=UPI000988678D|nr:universal stress protein [Sediminibacillus massiliensis]